MHDVRSQHPTYEWEAFSIRTCLGVIAVRGDLDMWAAPQLAAAIRPVMCRGGHVRINMRDVTFIDSAGLHVLADTATQLGITGRLVVINPSRVVTRAIELIGLHPDVEVVPPTHGHAA